MKTAAYVKLLTLALVAISVGGRAEARGAPHGHSSGGGLSHGAHLAAPHMAQGGFHEAHLGGHSLLRTETIRGHGRQASWQTYGRFAHASMSGRAFRHRGFSGGGGLQCVTFARSDTGIELTGNARDWWENAEGVYQRGSRPEAGSVLNFRANGAMRMGHVAVVDQVVDGRTLIIDHANWGGPGAGRGAVSRNISVVDVSPSNDWSAVRVALGHSGEYGSIYPTYGFIYNRPDGGAILASANTGAAMPAMNPAPRDLRPREQTYDEVAEAPDSVMPAYPHHGSHHRHHGVSVVGHHAWHRHGA